MITATRLVAACWPKVSVAGCSVAWGGLIVVAPGFVTAVAPVGERTNNGVRPSFQSFLLWRVYGLTFSCGSLRKNGLALAADWLCSSWRSIRLRIHKILPRQDLLARGENESTATRPWPGPFPPVLIGTTIPASGSTTAMPISESWTKIVVHNHLP